MRIAKTLNHCACRDWVVFLLLAGLFLTTSASRAADSPWQPARIVEVRTVTNSRTTAWVVNTPIIDEENVCLIIVHSGSRVFRASYGLGKTQPPPPAEWTKHAPVRLQVAGDRLFLKGRSGDEYRLHIESTKAAAAMDPWTADEIAAEKNATVREQEQTKSLIGFDEPATRAKPAPEESVPPPETERDEARRVAEESTTGTVSVRSTPYLADLYVDGENMGYTPAKVKLPPGKHTFRCEKAGYVPWTKEITLTVGSELTLDATLAHK
jgi:hypothetical protein